MTIDRTSEAMLGQGPAYIKFVAQQLNPYRIRRLGLGPTKSIDRTSEAMLGQGPAYIKFVAQQLNPHRIRRLGLGPTIKPNLIDNHFHL